MVQNTDSKVNNGAFSKFFIDCDMEQVELLDTGVGRVVAFSSKSPDREGANEDAALVAYLNTDTLVLAIADGFGGHPSGAEAARLALDSLEATLRNRDPEDEMRTSVLNGFEMANEAVRGLGVGAATTLAVVEIQQSWVRSYHVGDSGIVVVGQRGLIKHRTVDHSPTGYAVEAGLMNDREAIRHEERHIVSNMVGSAEMRIEMGPSIQLAPRDTVLMATDGLFDNIHFDRILDEVRAGDLEKKISALSHSSQRRMLSESSARPSKPDDMTVLAFRRRIIGKASTPRGR